MDHLFDSQFSWSNFFITALGLLALYFVLQFARQVLSNTNLMGDIRLPLLKSIERILLFYEPIVLLILVSIFVLINPSLHGLWIALLAIGGFSHIRNYISGRILQIEKSIAIGNKVKANQQEGVISKIGRLGLQLKTAKGTQHINYSKLNADGFMVLTGQDIGGFYHLKIKPQEPNEKLNYSLQLMDLFASSPYLDWNFKPTLKKGDDFNLHAKIMVREDNHLQDLIRLIEEHGFACKLK